MKIKIIVAYGFNRKGDVIDPNGNMARQLISMGYAIPYLGDVPIKPEVRAIPSHRGRGRPRKVVI